MHIHEGRSELAERVAKQMTDDAGLGRVWVNYSCLPFVGYTVDPGTTRLLGALTLVQSKIPPNLTTNSLLLTGSLMGDINSQLLHIFYYMLYILYSCSKLEKRRC